MLLQNTQIQNLIETVPYGIRAREIQSERFKDNPIFSNAMMSSNLVKKVCQIQPAGISLLKNAMEKLGLSARASEFTHSAEFIMAWESNNRCVC